MGVSEQSYTLGSDSRGRKVGSRTFKVWSVAPQAVITNPAIYGLPAVGSSWEGMIADSITVSTSGVPTTAYELSVNYSDTGQFKFPARQDDTVPGFTSTSGGEFQTEVSIPFYQRQVVAFPAVGGDINRDQWVLDKDAIEETRERLVRRAVIQSTDLLAMLNASRAQRQNIHAIFGGLYLYKGVTYQQRDATSFDVEYSWESDAGTLFDLDVQDNPDLIMPGPFDVNGSPLWVPGQGAAYFRPPFSYIVPLEKSRLEFVALFRFPKVLNGYQQLVGIGIP